MEVKRGVTQTPGMAVSQVAENPVDFPKAHGLADTSKSPGLCVPRITGEGQA